MQTRLLLLALLLTNAPLAFGQPVECKTDIDCKSQAEQTACLPQKTGCPGHESVSTCVIRTCQKRVQPQKPEENAPTDKPAAQSEKATRD